MKKRTSFAAVVAVMSAFLILTGCGAQPGGVTESPSTPTEATKDLAPESSENVTTAENVTTPEETETTSEETTAAADAYPKDRQLNVLLIGNSFSYYNDMNQPNGIFKKIVESAGYKVRVTAVYKGGYYLRQFLDENDSYGKQVLTLLRSKTKYDVVVIQEQSANPIANPGDFYDACRGFKELVDANGGRLYLYETWGYKTGHSSLKTYGTSTADMEAKLRAAYSAIGEELGVTVAYAGAAFTKSFTEKPSVELYHTDSKHPSETGSYLIAYTLFGTIFGDDPAALTYNGTQKAETAGHLRAVASEIVKNGVTVDDKYKTSSVGVVTPEKQVIPEGVVDSDKTVMLTSQPKSGIISVLKREDKTTGNGWMTDKTGSGTFSGIRGDKDAVASAEYSDSALTDAQKADIADKGYGVSVIGIEYMDSSKKGTSFESAAGKMTSVGNLVNGHWGTSYMAAMFFDKATYNIGGVKEEDAPYTGLITLNFGEKKTFEAIGWLSGSLDGFAKAAEAFVSDDGENWTKVPSACYDASKTELASLDTSACPDPWNKNKATVEVLFSMGGVSGKYVRIGIIRGGSISSNLTGLQEINTREIVVFGE